MHSSLFSVSGLNKLNRIQIKSYVRKDNLVLRHMSRKATTNLTKNSEPKKSRLQVTVIRKCN